MLPLSGTAHMMHLSALASNCDDEVELRTSAPVARITHTNNGHCLTWRNVYTCFGRMERRYDESSIRPGLPYFSFSRPLFTNEEWKIIVSQSWRMLKETSRAFSLNYRWRKHRCVESFEGETCPCGTNMDSLHFSCYLMHHQIYNDSIMK